MRRKAALILALIGVLFFKIAIWLDSEAIKDVLREVAEKMKNEPSPKKPDQSGLYPREYFEEPH